MNNSWRLPRAADFAGCGNYEGFRCTRDQWKTRSEAAIQRVPWMRRLNYEFFADTLDRSLIRRMFPEKQHNRIKNRASARGR